MWGSQSWGSQSWGLQLWGSLSQEGTVAGFTVGDRRVCSHRGFGHRFTVAGFGVTGVLGICIGSSCNFQVS